VRTGEVELEGIGAGLLGHLGQRLPVVLVVAAHDAGDHDLVRKVTLYLRDASEEVKTMAKNTSSIKSKVRLLS